MIVTKRGISGLIVEIIICMVLHFWIESGSSGYSAWIVQINVVILVLAIQQIAVMKFSTGKLLHFSSIFIGFAYLFLLSYQYLILISYDFGSMSYGIPTARYGIDTYMWACNFATEAIQFLYTGILFGICVKGKEKSGKSMINTDSRICALRFQRFGRVLLILAFIANIYQLYYGLSNNIYQGTGALDSTGILITLVNYIAYTLLPACMLLVYQNRNYVLYRNTLSSVYIVFEIILMMTGVRAQHIINIIIFIYFYYSAVQKLRLRTILLGVIAAFCMLYVITVIRYGRSSGNYVLALSSAGGNILLNTMSEFGFTINTLCIAKQAGFEHMTGGQFLFSILSVIPKSKTLWNEFALNNNVYDALNLYRYGSSFVTDIYFDFAEYASIIFVIYGLFVQKLTGFFERNLANGNILRVVLIAPFLTRVLFTVRTSCVNLPRLFVWILVYMLFIFLVSKRIKFGNY